MPVLLIVALLGGAVVLYVALENRFKMRGTLGRVVLSVEDIYEAYFKDGGYEKTDVLTLWKEISVALEVPQGVLRPHDQFGKDVGAGFVTTPDLDALTEKALNRAKQDNISIDLGQIKTVGEYVRLFAKKSG